MENKISKTNLSLGADVIQLLIPHRRPFLMVDRITHVSFGERPTIRTSKYLSANEPIFDGHFPKLLLMPGAYTFEGMGQSTNILAMMIALREIFQAKGEDPEEVLDQLKQIERAYSLSPEYHPKKHKILSELNQIDQSPRYGMVGAVNMKFIEPIKPGNIVEYEAILTGTFENLLHYEIQAVVNEVVKARGTLSSIKNIGNLNSGNL